MRVLLVDDEPLALERLRVGFADIEDVEIVGSASNGEQALEQITALEPDLVILDVQMPGPTGIAVAQAVSEREKRPEIVFVTAFDHYATDAFDVEAADYLLKPVRFDRLKLAVERARRRRALTAAGGKLAELETLVASLQDDQPTEPPQEGGYDLELWVPTRQGVMRVAIDTIDWIEAARDYVLLNTATRSHILRTTMSELERRLAPAIMLRVHRSHFVRKAAVTAIERPGKGVMVLRLTDDATVQVGPNYISAVNAALKLDH